MGLYYLGGGRGGERGRRGCWHTVSFAKNKIMSIVVFCIASLIEYANQLKLEVMGSHFSEKQQENQSVLIHINCQRQVGNIMCKMKRAGDCVAEVVSKVSKVSTRKSVDSFNWKIDKSK